MVIALSPIGAWYLVALGAAAGLTVLAASAYLQISPASLRRLALGMAALATCRYLAMAHTIMLGEQALVWSLLPSWYATAFILTFPGLLAFDQLVRDPRVTPTRLLTMYAPLFLGYLLVMALGEWEPQRHSGPAWWPMLLAVVQVAFAAGLIVLVRKAWKVVTAPAARIALSSLIAAYSLLAVDSIWTALRHGARNPSLIPEVLVLLSVWFSLRTSQQPSN